MNILTIFPALISCVAIAASAEDIATIPDAELASAAAALVGIETAYVHQDLDEVLKYKDFEAEARYMAISQPTVNPVLLDPEILAMTAKVLRAGFIKQIKQDGYPKLDDVTCVADGMRQLKENYYAVKETYSWKDGSVKSVEMILAKTPSGWRVLVPLP